ncbi:MAG TPA: adenylate/guanylate cyclase domain-containing protein, partial [Pyrinomonadaceae bacterium]|nr:adenylate/guanylate cyclase domain-containing protein [Pyrinomonadaceae bacterium]
RNFTAFAEKREPEQVVDYLESLFEFMVEIVNRHHGIVNKFLGDGFMAVWHELGDYLAEAIPMGNVLVKGRKEAIQVYQVA